jgi:hypothetical protein
MEQSSVRPKHKSLPAHHKEGYCGLYTPFFSLDLQITFYNIFGYGRPGIVFLDLEVTSDLVACNRAGTLVFEKLEVPVNIISC